MSERERIINSINESMFRDEDKGCVRPSEIADWHMAEVARYKDEIALLNKIIRGEDGAICANGGENGR